MLDPHSLLDLVRETLSSWNLEATSIDLISESENLVYKATTTAGLTFAVRLHRPGYHTLEELKSEQLWTRALNDSGINVPIGYPLPGGGYYKEIVIPHSDAVRQVGVVEWLEGRSLAVIMNEESDINALIQHFKTLGIVAGKINKQSSKWLPPKGFTRHHLNAEGFMGDQPFWGPFWDVPELSKEQKQLFRKLRDQIYRILSDLDRSPDNYNMIHADLHADNLLVDQNTLTVIDFDDAGYGWYLYEIAVAMFDYRQHKHFGSLRDAFVDGYSSEKQIEWLELLPLFFLIRALASIGWLHHRRSEIDRSAYIQGLIVYICAQCKTVLPD